ncbi:hypothetical protein ARMSODRAFT_1083902 [Armillaria solidipes]|uniref:Uncharacterized protein n=1 Tax=Armillaria solidipes TaxID=1076256 RepID=A0A2H3BJE6_9AGAR|nr:hypothetical protein ARMSODRAFT_1083902 [Armillaria solidipes]
MIPAPSAPMPDPAHSNTTLRCDILPANLADWRSYECGPQDDPHDHTWLSLWSRLQPLLSVRGYTLWEKQWGFSLMSPSDRGPSPNGFLYHTPTISDSYQSLYYVTPSNANIIAARHNDGRDVMIRIITADGEDHDTLRIVKKICTGEEGLLSSNHALPLLEVFEYNDLTFGVFPLVAVSLTRSINSWPKSLEFRKPVCGPNKEHRGSVPPRNVSQTIATSCRCDIHQVRTGNISRV